MIRGYRFFQLKAYFDKGFGYLNYIKYPIVLLGINTAIKGEVWTIVIVTLLLMITCFIVGFIFYHYGFVEAETEVGNKYNPFVQEFRKKFGIPRSRKV